MKQITENDEQRLFVIPFEGGGFSCLGFDVCERWTRAMINEINSIKSSTDIKIDASTIPANGTIEAYNYYIELINRAGKIYKSTGYRFTYELNPKLIGLEGRKVTAKIYGEVMTFKVGKSTGFVPCHLMIKGRARYGDSIPAEANQIEIIKIH